MVCTKTPLTESELIEICRSTTLPEFDLMLNEVSNLCNLQISKDIGEVLCFNGFYLKKWESYENNLTQLLNQNLILPPKPVKDAPRERPNVDLVHQEIRALQKMQQTEIMGIVDDDSVVQLSRRLKRDYYSVKNVILDLRARKENTNSRTLRKLKHISLKTDSPKENYVV